MDLLNPVYTEKAECQDCYKCLRECVVKAIKVENGRAAVVSELCVLCGHCVQVCPVGAKKVRNDLGRARRLVETDRRVIVSLAPSFVSEFPGLDPLKMVSALKKLGFQAVSETARGADLVARQVARLMNGEVPGTEMHNNVFISSACPTVVEYICKFHPGFAPAITAIYSPLMAHARELKDLYGPDTAVVFIGPCISKKRESDTSRNLVDVAIDFQDLRLWFESAGIDVYAEKAGDENTFLPARAGEGVLYPMDGGMISALRQYSVPSGTTCMAFSGLEEIGSALEGLDRTRPTAPVFLELLACPGGCINGPRSRTRSGTVEKRLSVRSYADTAPRDIQAEDASLAFHRVILPVSPGTVSPGAIAAELKRTGKHTREDELNCGGCGYDTCRAFAAAMATGVAEPGMCVSYMRKLAQKKANGLIRSIPSGVVIVDKDLSIVECNSNFARIVGEEALRLWELKPGLEGASLEKILPFQRYFHDVLHGAELVDRDVRLGGRIVHATIFGIERGEYTGGVFQDVTDPRVRKDRIVSQARKVINKNLAVVQKIAYLLGENAAETEATLSSIIESYETEAEDVPAVSNERGAR